MGTLQRDWVEIAEQEVANAFTKKSKSKYINSIKKAIESDINKNYPNDTITHAEWIGAEDYSAKGDVKVYLKSGREVPVELKFSKSKGSGTKFNPTTNILKKYIDDPRLQSYPEYDEMLGLKKTRYDMVESLVGHKMNSAAEYERNLRIIKKTNKPFIKDIADITKGGQIEYAFNTSKIMNEHLEGVQKMVDNVLDGNNTTTDVEITNDLIYCVVKNFENSKQSVEIYDFDDMDSKVANVISVGKSIKIQNKMGKDILRMSVHWKNICQGGSTPCFNGFVGNAYG